MENIKKSHGVIWQEAYGILKSALPNHAVHAWIDPIVCTGLDKNILLLAVPNRFFKEWIESHYISNIDTALKTNNGSIIKCQIFVLEKKENKMFSDQDQTQLETKTKARINNLNPQFQ